MLAFTCFTLYVCLIIENIAVRTIFSIHKSCDVRTTTINVHSHVIYYVNLLLMLVELLANVQQICQICLVHVECCCILH